MIKSGKRKLAALMVLLLAGVLPAVAEGPAAVLPESLGIIEAETFLGNTALEKVIVPEGTTEIGERAFAGSGLKEIVLPVSLTAIAENAFEGCSHLEIVAQPGSFAWKWADERGFYQVDPSPASDFIYTLSGGECIIHAYTGSGAQVCIPDEIEGCPVTGITGGAFEARGDIVRVVFPQSLKAVYAHAFGECTGLESVILPEGLEFLEAQAFSNCTGLEQVAAPLVWDTGLDSGGKCVESPFYGCLNLKRVILYEGASEIPDFTFRRSLPVDGVYMNYGGLEEVVIPATVRRVGVSAFQDVAGIRRISLPKGVEEIGSGAFYGCTALEEVSLPEGLTTIESAAFGGCSALESIVLPRSLSILEMSAFVSCESLSEVTAPLVWETGRDSDGAIVDSPFYLCRNLKRIELYEGITKIPDFAFQRSALSGGVYGNYDALEAVIIPSTVKTIGSAAFSGAVHMTHISLPEGVEEIRSGAFYGCTALESVDFPESVAVIESAAFANCGALTSVILPEGLEVLEMSAFANCAALETVTAPLVWETGLDVSGEIIDSPFYECLNLRTVRLHEGLTEIPDYAFAKASFRGDGYSNYDALAEIHIPATVQTFGTGVFEGCEDLVICGTAGSAAEIYAGENGFAFRECA